jgi:hypothetical protein
MCIFLWIAMVLLSLPLCTLSQDVVGFRLIQAGTNRTVAPLWDGAVVVFPPNLTTTGLAIEALTTGLSITSVVFDYNALRNVSIETMAPYALCGNTGPNFKRCTFLTVGTHRINATISNVPGRSRAITFTLVNASVAGAVPVPMAVPKASPIVEPVSRPIAVPVMMPVPIPQPVPLVPATVPMLRPAPTAPVVPPVIAPVLIPPKSAPTVAPRVIPIVAPIPAPVLLPAATTLAPIAPPSNGTLKGQLGKYTLNESFDTVLNSVVVTINATRGIHGIAFDPVDHANTLNPTIYISTSEIFHNEARNSVGNAVNGKIQTVRGANLDLVTDIVRGLPVSALDHSVRDGL